MIEENNSSLWENKLLVKRKEENNMNDKKKINCNQNGKASNADLFTKKENIIIPHEPQSENPQDSKTGYTDKVLDYCGKVLDHCDIVLGHVRSSFKMMNDCFEPVRDLCDKMEKRIKDRDDVYDVDLVEELDLGACNTADESMEKYIKCAYNTSNISIDMVLSVINGEYKHSVNTSHIIPIGTIMSISAIRDKIGEDFTDFRLMRNSSLDDVIQSLTNFYQTFGFEVDRVYINVIPNNTKIVNDNP